jgi:hypothetical protein
MKNSVIILLVTFGILTKAQNDSTVIKPTFTEKRHEIGIGVLSPFLMIVGASDFNERYTNLSYRYRINQNQAFKVLIGNAFFNSNENRIGQDMVQATPGQTIYINKQYRTPSNFQIGLGYEYMFGKNKLKHVLGVDFIYNNKFNTEYSNYFLEKDTLNANGIKSIFGEKIDTGAVTLSRNYNKCGANFSYYLRYVFSKKWLMTSSFILNYRVYRRKVNNTMVGISEFNINGLIADISIFYRF